MGQDNRGRVHALLRDYIESLFVAVVLALVIRMFIVSAYRIPTTSMWPTLLAGDFVFAYKLPYGIKIPLMEKKLNFNSIPARGDVVVFRYPGDESISYIKRVAALAGDKIEIRNKRLFVNGTPAAYENADVRLEISNPDSYRFVKENIFGSSRTVMFNRESKNQNFGPEIVPPGQFFALGDNRDSSDDSRYWGMVPIANIDGKVVAVWLSIDWETRFGFMPFLRWNRLFHPI